MTTSNLKHWLSRGELDKLENVVLEGRGFRLLGEQSPDLRTRVFLKGLPNYLTKIQQIHDAVVRGSLPEVQRLVDGEPKKKLVIAKDQAGTPLIHKAVYYDHQDVVEWIVDNYPTAVDQKDKEGRAALHYCAACRDPEAVWDILIEAGCDAGVCDKRGNPAAYYLQRGAEIELPDPDKMPGHRSRRRNASSQDRWQSNSLDFKPSNIRIWIHNRDIGKLQQVLWEGHGAKLRCETSNNVRVRRFLEAVPFIMVTIKDIHTAVIKNDLDTFRKKVEEPVSPIILSSKDSNGLNVLHKAAGLGYVETAKEILEKYPAIVTLQDNDGRIPLHYAAVCRDGGVMYDLLVEYGSDESKLDNRGKAAAFYKNRPMDIDLTSLVTVPDAPRVSSNNYPRHWDWRIIDSDQPLPRIKRTGNNADDDSAFGSAESAKLTEDITTPEIENVEDELNGNEEENGAEDEPAAEEGETEANEDEAEGETETAAGEKENPQEEENEDEVEPAGEEGEPDANNNNEVAEVEAEAEPTPEADPEAPAEVESEEKIEAEIEAEVEATIDAEAELGAAVDVQAEAEIEAETEADVEADADVETVAEVEAEILVIDEIVEPDVGVEIFEIEGDADVDTEVVNETEAGAEGEAEGQAEATEEAEVEAKEETEAEVEEETEAEEAKEETDAVVEEEAEAEEAEEETDAKAEEEAEAGEAEEETDAKVKEETEAEAAEETEAEAEGEAEAETKAEDRLEVEAGVEVGDGVEGGEEADAEAEEPEAQEDTVAEDADKETGEAEMPAEEAEESDEKAEPSTADSGVARTPNDEEQAGEDEEAAAAAEDEEENNAEEEGEEEKEQGQEEDAEPAADDEEAAELAENGTMEQLAALVLSGEGHRLVNRHSSNPELQAFIDNVPTYMSKIRAVHKASKDGNLKELQVSLDRRKFAMAKDQSSPHGATPLHVAVIFGHTMIVRYLAGRFPETTHALDLDGRTPLHYAATLADNGHYYNLLLHLGANPLVQDNFGQKAEYYKENQDDLSHKQLLRDFGAPESLADEMLADKDLKIFHDEEGRYLASSLGDPLIKGLTEVATTRPKDPVTYLATYLYNFANQEKPKDEEESNILIIPEEQNGHDDDNQEESSQDNENDDGYPQSPDLDSPESLFTETERDENGQSSLHFAANRSHSKDGLYHHLQETQINIALRDSRYRTGRDVAEASGNKENVQEIDRFVVYLAARGETDKLVELLMEGYDHILDTEDDNKNILQIAEEEGNTSTVEFLKSIENYTDLRDEIHRGVRSGNLLKVRELLEMNGKGAKLLALGKNTMGRCSLHIAVLREHEDIVRYLAKTYPETLRIGDNLERTALHYAMGVPSVEAMSSTLIKAGAKRIQKDLKSRQPSYYYMNKTDIEKLQQEEESLEK